MKTINVIKKCCIRKVKSRTVVQTRKIGKPITKLVGSCIQLYTIFDQKLIEPSQIRRQGTFTLGTDTVWKISFPILPLDLLAFL